MTLCLLLLKANYKNIIISKIWKYKNILIYNILTNSKYIDIIIVALCCFITTASLPGKEGLPEIEQWTYSPLSKDIIFSENLEGRLIQSLP